MQTEICGSCGMNIGRAFVDLDTGKVARPGNGPDSYYINTEQERIRLMLNDEVTLFGLLCATMLTTGTPHGPCSGPYLHV
jgi:hypothetical protein